MSDPPRKRLLRSTDDRILAGVAGGIASYLDVDPTLVRVGFVAAVLFGGLGIVAYLVLAVVTPNDDGSGSPVQGERPSIGLVVVAVLAVLILLPGPFWGPFDWGIGWWWGGSLWLLVLAAGGVWLYMTLRDRRRAAPPPGEASGGEPATPETAVTEPLDRTGTLPARSDRTNRFVRAIAIGVLIFAALCVAAAVAAVSAWAAATGRGEIIAGVVIAIGVALVGAAFIGEPRWRWLILPALVLALPAGGVAAADLRFDSGIGERDHRPASFGAIPDDGYSLGVGQMTVDLRGLPWRSRDTLELETDMGIGETVVSVPSDVCVEPDARTRAGEVFVRGQHSSGVDPEVSEVPPEGKAPRLVLDSEVDIGALKVSDRAPSELRGGDHHDGFDASSSENEAERARAEKACES